MPEVQHQFGASLQERVPFLCLAWQWRKRLLKATRGDARHEYAAQEQEALALAAIPFSGDKDALDALTEHVDTQFG